MQIKKRLMALFLAATTAFLSMPFVTMAADEEWGATGQFGATPKAKNIKTYTEAANSHCVTTERAGRGGITLIPNHWARNILSVDVTNGVRPVGGQNVYVEVDYYDDTARGLFTIQYNSSTEKMKHTRNVYTKGTNKWQTESFILYAPTFTTDTYLGDFIITTSDNNHQSVDEVVIGGVRVKTIDKIAPAGLSIDFSKDPRNYYEGEQLEFTLNFDSTVPKSCELDLTIEVLDSYDEVVATWKDTFDMKGMKKTSKTFKPDFETFGRHTLRVMATNEEFGYEVESFKDFSYCVKSDFTNERFGTITHLGWGQTGPQEGRNPAIVYPMMKNAGIGWSRDHIEWADIEKTPGHFELLPHHEQLLDMANEYGIKLLLLYGGGNPIYAEGGSADSTPWHNEYPRTQEGFELFGNYVYNLIKLVGDRADTYEYWNEFGWGGADYPIYHDFAKAMYEATMRANPDLRTVGISSAGTGVELIQYCFPLGAEHLMDDVSYHHYTKSDPYTSGVETNSKMVRETLNKFETGKDKKIWLTEMGGTSIINTYTDLAHFMVKEYAIHFQEGLVDYMFAYDFSDDGTQNENDQNHFGITESFKAYYEDRFLAKPSYVAIANMNDKLGTPVHKKTMKLNDNRVHVYQYERTQDGMEVVIAWSQQENEFATLDFGAEVEVYDIYGNKIEMQGDNGEYSFILGNKPIVIVGEFDDVKEGTPRVIFSETSLISPINDKATVTIYKTTKEDLKIEIGELPENTTIKVLNKPKFNGKMAQIEMEFDGRIGFVDELPIKVISDTGHVYYDGSIRIEYAEGLEISGRSQMYRDDDPERWKLALDIVSHYREKDLVATMDIISPSILAQKNIKLGTLKKGKNHVEFHLNMLSQFSSYEIKCRIKLDNGYEEIVSFPIDFAVAYKAKKPPEIDGVLEEGEWDQRGTIVSDLEEQWYPLIMDQPWKGPKDLSCRSWTEWDEDNLYIAWEVTDDVHYTPYTGGTIWNADCIQIAIAFIRERITIEMPDGAPASSFSEIGFGLGPNNEETLYRYSVEEGAPYSLEKSDVAMKREGDKTIYELRLDWEDVLVPGIEIKENLEFSYAFLVNENDRNGRSGALRFGDGIIQVPKIMEKTARIRLMSGDLN